MTNWIYLQSPRLFCSKPRPALNKTYTHSFTLKECTYGHLKHYKQMENWYKIFRDPERLKIAHWRQKKDSKEKKYEQGRKGRKWLGINRYRLEDVEEDRGGGRKQAGLQHKHTILCSQLTAHTHIVVFTHIATYYQCTQARLLKPSSVLTHTQAIQHTVCVFSFANLPVDKVSIYQTDTHRAAAGLSTGIYDILQHLECRCAQHVKLLRRNGVNASKSVHVLMFFSC